MTEHLLLRPRLIDKFNEGLSKKITKICAPAGYGKTTLANQWLSKLDKPAATVALDDKDNALFRFLSNLITAMQKGGIEVGGAIKDIPESHDPLSEVDKLLSDLVNDLKNEERKCILVLDDLHLIREPKIYDILSILLEKLPPKIHIIIISRKEPDLPLEKLRFQHQLTEITAQDLRFTRDEIEIYLNQTMKLDLSPEEIDRILRRSEGWIMGLQLGAISLSDNRSVSDRMRHFSDSNQSILDYLTDKVLACQSESVRQFLLRTSILEQMSPDLCNEVVGIENSRTILEKLIQSNLFIFPLDKIHHCYRYHHLFAKLLRFRLRKTGEAKLRELYRRAFEWHRSRDLSEEAIDYAIKGQLFEQAADMIEKKSLVGLSSVFTQEWLNHLPEGLFLSKPKLGAIKGYLQILQGEFRSAEKIFENLVCNPAQDTMLDEMESRVLEGKLALGRSMIAILYKMDGTVAVEEADNALKKIPNYSNFERWIAYIAGGGAFTLLGDLNQAEHYLDNARTLSDHMNITITRLLTLLHIGHLRMAGGKLNHALHHFQNAYRKISKKKQVKKQVCQVVNFITMTGLGKIHYECNRLEPALAFLLEACGVKEFREALMHIVAYHDVLIRVHWALGNYKEAEEILRQTEGNALNLNASAAIIRRVDALKASLALKKGDLDAASQWGDKFIAEFASDFNGQARCELEPELLVLARFYIAQETLEPAITLLQTMLDLTESQGRFGSAIQIQILLAKAWFMDGYETKGMEIMARALLLGKGEGYVRTFLDEGRPVKSMLERLLEFKELLTNAGDITGYIKRLLAYFNIDTNPEYHTDSIDYMKVHFFETFQAKLKDWEILHYADDIPLSLIDIDGDPLKIMPQLQSHQHTFYEILYIQRGEGWHYINSKSYPIKPHTIYFLSPGQKHYLKSIRMFQGKAIFFSEEFLLSNKSGRVIFEQDFFKNLEGSPCLQLKRDQIEHVTQFIKNIQKELETDKERKIELLHSHLYVFFMQMQRILPVEADRTDFKSLIMSRFTALVIKYCKKEKNISFYAKRLGINEKYLFEVTKKATGITPGDIIHGEVIKEAKQYLENTDLSIKEIAYKLGFCDPAYFSRYFKREAGITAGKFREQARESLIGGRFTIDNKEDSIYEEEMKMTIMR